MKRQIIFCLLGWLLIGVAQAATTQVAALEAGKKTYNAFCIYCHGATGEGNGLASDLNGVPIIDISNRAYMSLLSDQDLYDRVAYGKERFPYIQMPGWRSNLDPQEIKTVVAYVRSIAVDKGPLKGPTPQERETLFNNSSLEQGRIYYLKYCSNCHGKKGDGTGQVATKMQLKPVRFDNHEIVARLTKESIAEYLTDTSEQRGRFMPVFNDFIKEYADEILLHIKTLPK